MKNETHFIKAGWSIDGTGAAVQTNVLLAIKDGVILNISCCNHSDEPDSSLITDLSQCTILPPLVDSHVHLALSPSTDPVIRKKQLAASYKERKTRITNHIHSLFSHGVLAVRDGGDHLAHVFRYGNETVSEKKNKKSPVTLKTTSRAYYRQGRYGSFLGKAITEGETLRSSVTKEDASVDHIKLINSGVNSITKFAEETTPQFSFTEIKDLADHIRIKKIKLMVHANGRQPVLNAVEAGCHSIEHGFFMETENLTRMADKQTFWVPTAVTMKTLLDNWDANHRPGNRDVIRKTLDSQLELMARARMHGVRLTLGTDAGSSGIAHGKSVADELQLFIEAGYPLVEAIQCASTYGAELLSVDTIAPIVKGNPASFIAIQASPSMLPHKLSAVEGIYSKGRRISFHG